MTKHSKFASGVAAYAAGIRIRSWRYLVSEIDGHSAGQYRSFTHAQTVLVAVAYRLNLYGIPAPDALRMATDALGPVFEPIDGYEVVPAFMPTVTAGMWLHVAVDMDGVARATVGRRLPLSEGVFLDVGALTATVVERLNFASPSPYPSAARDRRLTKIPSGSATGASEHTSKGIASRKSTNKEVK